MNFALSLYDQTLPSLEEYILVNSKHQRIEIFRRQENNIWVFETYSPTQPQIAIYSINLELAIGDVYEDITLLAQDNSTD